MSNRIVISPTRAGRQVLGNGIEIVRFEDGIFRRACPLAGVLHWILLRQEAKIILNDPGDRGATARGEALRLFFDLVVETQGTFGLHAGLCCTSPVPFSWHTRCRDVQFLRAVHAHSNHPVL